MNNKIQALNEAAFQRIFADYTQQEAPPQLVAGLISADQVLSTFTLGFKDSSVATETQFRIASMTKCFAAAMLLKLRDEQKIKLTDQVAKFIPTLKDSRWMKTTIFDLLTMRSGLPTDDPWGDRLLPYSDQELSSVYSEDLTFAADSGREFHYSNLGYMLLGRVISVATGVSALKAIKDELLIPLGMQRTEWIPSGKEWLPGFTAKDSHLIEQPIDQTIGDGAVFGGLWSTLSDLAIWLTFLIDANQHQAAIYQKVLSLASRQELQQGVVRVSPPKFISVLNEGFDYALGLSTFINRELTFVGHSGGLPGYGSHFRWHQETKLGVIALANLTYASVYKPCQEALRIVVLNQQASCKSIPTLVKDRALQLFDYLKQGDLDKDDSIFALNFFKDNPLDSFQLNFKDLSKKFNCISFTNLTVLPEPGLGARLVIDNQVVCSFSLSPGESGKIQELIITT